MPLLAATNLRFAYGDRVILDGVSLSVEEGERIGVVGRNGTGKSTMLRIMGGLRNPDSGEVNLRRGRTAGYLAQDPDFDPNATLRDVAAAAFDELAALHHELDGVFANMAGAEGDVLEALLAKQTELEKQIEAKGGYAIDHRIDAVLHGLGFTDAQFGIRSGDLSGGQRGRLGLAKLLLEDHAVLLLDEPTNHLDLDGRLWLERFLVDDFKGAVVLISHDRYLLDRVVHRIVEVEHARLIDYPGNYAAFREQRTQRRLTQLRAYEKQQTEFKREEAFIRKFKAGQRAKQARGRETRLERAKAEVSIERPLEMDSLRLSLPKAERTGDIVAQVRHLSKKYPTDDGDEKVLFDDLELTINRGDRIGVIGPNGAGKTTLVRCILGEQQPDAGEVTLGAKLSVGHFRQTHDGLDLELTVPRHIQKVVRDHTGELMSEQSARDLAGAFLFSGREQEKELGLLSGGERARAMLAGLMASAKNVLVLDEPTNHLDIPSAERLEDTLAKPVAADSKQAGNKGGAFDGTLILISHDRALIDACCDRLLILDGKGHVTQFLGNYTEWTRATAEAAAEPVAKSAPKPKQAPKPKPAEKQAEPAKGQLKKEKTPRGRFSWMKPEQIEAKMTELETERRTIDAELADPGVWTDHVRANGLTERRDALSAELDELETEWLRKAET